MKLLKIVLAVLFGALVSVHVPLFAMQQELYTRAWKPKKSFAQTANGKKSLSKKQYSQHYRNKQQKVSEFWKKLFGIFCVINVVGAEYVKTAEQINKAQKNQNRRISGYTQQQNNNQLKLHDSFHVRHNVTDVPGTQIVCSLGQNFNVVCCLQDIHDGNNYACGTFQAGTGNPNCTDCSVDELSHRIECLDICEKDQADLIFTENCLKQEQDLLLLHQEMKEKIYNNSEIQNLQQIACNQEDRQHFREPEFISLEPNLLTVSNQVIAKVLNVYGLHESMIKVYLVKVDTLANIVGCDVLDQLKNGNLGEGPGAFAFAHLHYNQGESSADFGAIVVRSYSGELTLYMPVLYDQDLRLWKNVLGHELGHAVQWMEAQKKSCGNKVFVCDSGNLGDHIKRLKAGVTFWEWCKSLFGYSSTRTINGCLANTQKNYDERNNNKELEADILSVLAIDDFCPDIFKRNTKILITDEMMQKFSDQEGEEQNVHPDTNIRLSVGINTYKKLKALKKYLIDTFWLSANRNNESN